MVNQRPEAQSAGDDGAPFAAQLTGVPPISVGRSAGQWVVSLAQATMQLVTNPPLSKFTTNRVLVWDAINQTWIKVPMSAFGLSNQPLTQVSVPQGNQPNYSFDIQNMNLSVPGIVFALPIASTFSGKALHFNNIPGSVAFSVQANLADAYGIDGNTGAVLLSAGPSRTTLIAKNDGTANGGWFKWSP
jgi:hypothetical protein